MRLDDLAAAGDELALEVHAVDPVIYLIYRVAGEQLIPLVDEQGATLRFPSRHAAVQALREAGVREVDFVHTSAYGEMVGLDYAEGPNELRQHIKL